MLKIRPALSPLSRNFGDYELLEQVAFGGMGIVYRARHLALNRTVALKMILGGRLATAAMVQRFKTDGAVLVWEIAAGDPQQTFLGHARAVRTLSFGRRGDLLVSGSGDGSVKMWDLTPKVEPIVINDHSRGLAFSPDGKLLTSGSKVWSALDGALLTGTGTSARAGRLAFSPDGLFIANGLDIVNPATGNLMRTLSWPNSAARGTAIYSVSISPDGNFLAKLWDLETGREVFTLGKHDAMVEAVAFSPDSKRIASASTDHTIKIWSID